jgi:hypothetical protein
LAAVIAELRRIAIVVNALTPRFHAADEPSAA